MSRNILISTTVVLVLILTGAALSTQPPVRAAQQTSVPTATVTLPSVTPTVTATLTLPSVSPQIIIIATPAASPTPEPPFLEKHQTEIVTALLALIGGVLLRHFLPGLLKYGKKGLIWLYQNLRIERQLHSHYCKNVAGDLRKLKILGMVRPRDLEQIFIPLRIREYVRRDLPQGSGNGKVPAATLGFHDALEQFSHIVILGDPGAGKTTLAKHATVLCAERKLRINGRTYLPIYVPLNELKPFLTDEEASKREFEDILADVLKSYGFPEAKDFLIKHLKYGDCLILLDGFDELANERHQETVALKTRDLARSYDENNRIVLTSRVAGFRGALFSRFTTLEISDLPFEQAKAFVTRWFGDVPDKAERLINILQDNRRLQLLANNPLMLAVICITFEYHEILPQRRVDLYERCVDTLIRLWDESRGIDREALFDAGQKETVLRHVAFDFHVARKTDFSKAELLASIRKHLPKAKEKHYRDEEFLEEILEHTGIICQKAQDTFAFQHLTFQEYLAAQVLAKDLEMGTKFILDHLDDSWWVEPIVLTAGILRDATELTEEIYERVQRRPSDDVYLLLGRCLTDADLTNFELKDKVLSRVVAIAHAEE